MKTQGKAWDVAADRFLKGVTNTGPAAALIGSFIEPMSRIKPPDALSVLQVAPWQIRECLDELLPIAGGEPGKACWRLALLTAILEQHFPSDGQYATRKQ